MSFRRNELNSNAMFKMPAEGIPPLPKIIAPEFSQLLGAESPLRLFTDEIVFEEAKMAHRLNQSNLRVWGKKTVAGDIIAKDLNELLSLRGRDAITFKAMPAELMVANNAGSNRRTAFLMYSLLYSREALQKMYLPRGFPKSWFRGFEDFLQVINIPIMMATVGVELLFKMIGASLNQPFRKGFTMVFDARSSLRERILGGALGLISLPLWALSQPFFLLGNGVGQVRRIIDAGCNLVSSAISLVADRFREEKRYGVRYPGVMACLSVMIKNALQLLPKLILLGAALFPGGQVIPAAAVLAKGMLAPILAPVGHLLSAMIQPMVQAFSSVFSPMAAMFCAGSVTAATVAIGEQMIAGSIDKVGRSSWKSLFKRKVPLLRRQSQPTSSQESSGDTLLVVPKLMHSETSTLVVGRMLNQDFLDDQLRQSSLRQSQSTQTQLEMTELYLRRESMVVEELSSVQDYVYPIPPPPPPREPHPDDLWDMQPPPPPSEPHPDELMQASLQPH